MFALIQLKPYLTSRNFWVTNIFGIVYHICGNVYPLVQYTTIVVHTKFWGIFTMIPIPWRSCSLIKDHLVLTKSCPCITSQQLNIKTSNEIMSNVLAVQLPRLTSNCLHLHNILYQSIYLSVQPGSNLCFKLKQNIR